MYSPFTEKVLSIIADIPAGCVAVYSQIAAKAGNPKGARQVARILHSLAMKEKLPWHRVINAKGTISLTHPYYELQKSLLENEGIIFEPDNSINLKIYLKK